MKNDIGVLLGKRIRELREARNLSQAALAEKCLKSIETISNFERGKTIPSVLTLDRVAKALKVDVQSLFEFSPNSSKSYDVEKKMKLLSTVDQELVVKIIEVFCKERKK